MVLRCNRCASATSVNVNDDRLARLEALFSTRERAYAALTANLLPCDCGGAFELEAPPRCPLCRAPIDPEASHAQTGEAWRNFLTRDLVVPRWRMVCSFCGVEDDTVLGLDTARPVYACAKCRSPAA